MSEKFRTFVVAKLLINMKRLFHYLLKYLLFWLLFFGFFRILFLIFYNSLIRAESIPFIDICKVFYYSLPLDLSFWGYLMALPFFVIAINIFVNHSFFQKLSDGITYFYIVLCGIISMGEIGIFDEWRTKLNYKALVYLEQPSEIFNSISFGHFALLILVLISVLALCIFLYRKFFRYPYKIKIAKIWQKVSFLLISPLLLFYLIRGGIQGIPISQSDAWFSNYLILNDVSVNPSWNLMANIIKTQAFMDENPFISFDDEYAKQVVTEIHQVEKDTTISILTTAKPNIVLIILESWPASVIESIGGDNYITPNFNKLEKEGILFDNLYSSGNRSQQGMASIFGGFPAIPITTLTEYPEKYSSLPSLTKILNQNGWTSSFYFGGQLRYGNIKSYIIYNQFKRIFEGENFDNSIPRGRLGVHDEFLFAKNIQDLKTEKQPFFSVMFTMSSHSPYDQPIQNIIKKDISELPFTNSVFYTDHALGDYFANARKQDWYSNTLFIIVSDHSHVSHKNHPLQTFDYHQIPMLFVGDVLKPEFKGSKYKKIASQTDLPATLLKQLGFDASAFPWSKNLFNPYSPEFAYFEMNEGVGWKTPNGLFVYDKLHDKFLQKELDTANAEKTLIQGKAYLQEVFRQFLSF